MSHNKDNIQKLGSSATWQELTEGLTIPGSGTARSFKTGEWATDQPVFISEKCKQCLLCVPVCPDSCIPVKDGVRGEFDYEHCKGCGICVKSCPFGAIEMEGIR